ncbi:hypothetical protein [Baekduia alba]|uniref:hypothetical protein n=1 Tax=Baekduia alba TaxID=2997333 RepID=UPI0023412598|nr:hypothetical protein [Baekduia alba]
MTTLAVGAIIAIPLIFAALGAGQQAGLAFGVVLVVVGVAWMFFGSRDDGEGDGEGD